MPERVPAGRPPEVEGHGADRVPPATTLRAEDIRLRPYFQDGQVIIKRTAGVPGDRIQVDPETVRINGAKVGEGLALAGTLERPAEDFLRDDIIPPHQLWVMGATADSFDSRYWGFLPEQRVIGRAYALW